MGKFLHRSDDFGDAMHAFEGLLDRSGDLGEDVFQVGGKGGGSDLRHQLRADPAFPRGGEEEPRLLGQIGGQIAEAVLHELGIVADVLGRRIDLVGDAGSELPDGFHLLRVLESDFHLPPQRDVSGYHHEVLGHPEIVAHRVGVRLQRAPRAVAVLHPVFESATHPRLEDALGGEQDLELVLGMNMRCRRHLAEFRG